MLRPSEGQTEGTDQKAHSGLCMYKGSPAAKVAQVCMALLIIP